MNETMLWRGYSVRAARRAIMSMVYAVRLPDGVIKIGYTTNLDTRINHVASVNGVSKTQVVVLAVALGATLEDEAALHHKLVKYRHHGNEYYRPTKQVMAEVNRMRKQLGLHALRGKQAAHRWVRVGEYYA